ncbi:MAG: hypothetical protein RL186_1425 [Pseudomonadota bacterium]
MRYLMLSAIALSSLAALPAQAHERNGGNGQYGHRETGYSQGIDPRCLREKRTSRNVGGFLGALGGASAGRALAAAAVRPEGVILGTIVGAVVGASVGNAGVDCSPNQRFTQDHGRSYGAHRGPQAYVEQESDAYGQYAQDDNRDPRYDWYQPSSQSYYGQGYSGQEAGNYGQNAYYDDQAQSVVITRSYHAGPAVTYYPGQTGWQQPQWQPAPPPPCGYQRCR